MDRKDIALGILLIAVVSLAGGLGFVIVINSTKVPVIEPFFLDGLPDDWSTAPNSTYFTFYNQTGGPFFITLGDILEGVNLAEVGEQYEKRIFTSTIIDPITGLHITGVNILDFLEAYDTYFAGNITFASKEDRFGQKQTLSTDAPTLVEKVYGSKNKEPVIIALAANKTWLADSTYGDVWGNFSIFGKNMVNNLYNLDELRVSSNWTVKVKVNNGAQILYLSPNNLTSNPFTFTYSYDRDDDWNLNRQYWGTNMSTIIDYTIANGVPDFNLTIYAADGWKTPSKFESAKFYNKTEVYNGLTYDSIHWDYVNETSVPLPDVYGELKMNLAFALKINGEYDGAGTDTNPIWPYSKFCGYSYGPYVLVIPGRTRSNLLKFVTEIAIEF